MNIMENLLNRIELQTWFCQSRFAWNCCIRAYQLNRSFQLRNVLFNILFSHFKKMLIYVTLHLCQLKIKMHLNDFLCFNISKFLFFIYILEQILSFPHFLNSIFVIPLCGRLFLSISMFWITTILIVSI